MFCKCMHFFAWLWSYQSGIVLIWRNKFSFSQNKNHLQRWTVIPWSIMFEWESLPNKESPINLAIVQSQKWCKSMGYCNVYKSNHKHSPPSSPLRQKEMGAIQHSEWLTQSSLVYYKIPNRAGLSHYTDSILLCDQGDAAIRRREGALALLCVSS